MGPETERLSPALEDVIGQFTGILRHVCWRHRLTGADADELVQEVRVRGSLVVLYYDFCTNGVADVDLVFE